MTPRALDLFCGAGGASMGLHRAGFDVTGIDIKRQPRYPFRLIQADALRPPVRLEDFDLVWASPPCQAHVGFNASWNRTPHVSLIAATRALLSDHPITIIENVVGSPVRTSLTLCGSNFGLQTRRHRRFETSFFCWGMHCSHSGNERGVYGDHPQGHFGDGYRIPRAQSLEEARQAMGIDWMLWRELTQAIPPAYAEFIGREALRQLRVAA